VLPKDYARPGLDNTRLGELIDLIGKIELVARDAAGLFGPKDHRCKDILGRIFRDGSSRFSRGCGTVKNSMAVSLRHSPPSAAPFRQSSSRARSALRRLKEHHRRNLYAVK